MDTECGARGTQRVEGDWGLVGRSCAAERVRTFVEKAAWVELPVLILGAFGTGKKHLASALHAAGPRHKQPFTYVHCDALAAGTQSAVLADLFRQTEDGTIFFDGIDMLGYPLQGLLAQLLEYGPEAERRLFGPSRLAMRVIASTGSNLEERVQAGTFSQALLENVRHLPIQLLPLCERREDIVPLASYFLGHFAHLEIRTLSQGACAALQAYHWPRNVSELKRVMARLSVLADDDVIDLNDLCAHTPELLTRASVAPSMLETVRTRAMRPEATVLRGEATPLLDARLGWLVRILLADKAHTLLDLHSGLRRALTYLARHYTETITLSQLAEQALLSRSHLSFLFKQRLQVSFKTLLGVLRIERARHLLIERPFQSVTEISGEVGFGDLRHFERTFKRWTGKPPTAYRREALLS